MKGKLILVFVLLASFLGAVENDNFESRIKLPGTRPYLVEYLRNATAEAGEPGVSTFRDATVWYEWVPITSFTMSFPSYQVNIYQAPNSEPAFSDLIALESSQGSLNYRAGETYYLQILGSRGSVPDLVVINTAGSRGSADRPRIENASFENRIVLPSLTSLRTGADAEGTDPQTVGDSPFNFYPAWWSWTAPESGPYQLGGSDWFYGGACVLTGESAESLVEVACGGSEGLHFEAESGTTYHFARYVTRRAFFDDWLGFDLAKISVAPSNDDFGNAVDLGRTSSFSRLQENFLATAEPDEPSDPTPGELAPTRTVWFQWTPQFTGDYLVETGNESSRVAIFSGEQLDQLSPLAGVSSGSGSLTASLQSDTAYFLRVDSPEPISFTLQGNLVYEKFANNNHYSEAIVWSEAHHSAFGSSDLADLEEAEPRPEGVRDSNGSVWWKWTPRRSGATTIDFTGSSFYFTIYRGEGLENLEPLITHRSSFYDLEFYAEAGETYSFQLVSRSAVGFRDLALELNQHREALPNDLFAQAITLTGSEHMIEIAPGGKSIEAGESAEHVESVWYSWEVPEDGTYLLTSTRGEARAYRGNSLDSLLPIESYNRNTVIRGNAGDVIKIAQIEQRRSSSTLSITQVTGPTNDQFENRTDLGTAEDVAVAIDHQFATFEEREPEYLGQVAAVSSMWWTWTAPRSGTVSLTEETIVFTGSSLENLVPLDGGDPTNRFEATAGSIYQLSSVKRAYFTEDETIFQLAMTPPANDDLADRFVIPAELPHSWQGTLPNASFELAELQSTSLDGSAWWEWTAPRAGRVRFESSGDQMRIFPAGDSIADISPFTNSSSFGTETLAGETYFIQIRSESFEPADFEIFWVEPLPEHQVADKAQVIESFGEPLRVPATGRNSGKLWYRFVPSSGGTLSAARDDGSTPSVSLFTGPDLENLRSVPRQNLFDLNRFEIRAGHNYWLSIRISSGSAYSWTPSLGPADDNFENAPALPSKASVIWRGDTTGAGWQTGEPGIENDGPDRSVWRKWTAPHTGLFCFSIDRWRAAIFQGEMIDALTIIAEGRAGNFPATAGVTYAIMVDSFRAETAFELHINPVSSAYEIWQQLHFGNSTKLSGKPNADPDFDGRSNLLEFALGSDPQVKNGPVDLQVEADSETICLKVLRPTSREGVEYFFEISDDLENWQSSLTLDHESSVTPAADDHETYRVLLKNDSLSNRPKLFVRLRVRLLPSNQ